LHRLTASGRSEPQTLLAAAVQHDNNVDDRGTPRALRRRPAGGGTGAQLVDRRTSTRFEDPVPLARTS
jgi:hypothetical protein